MKRLSLFAALLAALFLVPFFRPAFAEQQHAFAIDQRMVLAGMERSWLQGYTPEISRNRLTLVLPLVSPSAQGSIHGEVILQDETLSLFPLQTMTATARPSKDGVWALRFSLELHKDRKNGDYPALLRITGTDAQGNPLQTDIPYTFRIRDGQPNTETARMQLSEVQANFTVGEDGCITALLTNPCKSVACEEITLRITDSRGDILPADAGTLYLGSLAPGEKVQFSFPMTVLLTSAVSPHVLDFALEWTALGQRVSQSESFTLPVSQDIRLEQGGLRMPSSVVAGDSVTLSLPLMNLGQGDVLQVLATLTLPGITDSQSVLVGTVSPGETKTAQLTVATSKQQIGTFTGTLDVRCTGSSADTLLFSLPVELVVDAPVSVPVESNPSKPSDTSPLLLYLGGGCALLLLLLILQGILLRRKIHRLEESGL